MGLRRGIALLVALLLIGGQAAATPVAAGAATSKAEAKKGKKAKKKKRKKVRKKAPAQPTAGAPGAQGPQGAQGPAGPAGPAGSSVVARVRSTGPMTAQSMGQTKVPLTGATWTQQADETDDFVGEVTMTTPAECTASGPGLTDDPVWYLEGQLGGWEYIGGAYVDVMLGKEWVGTAEFPAFPEEAGKTITRTLHIQRRLMEPGTPTERELTAQVDSYCEGDGESFTLQSLKVNVIGIR